MESTAGNLNADYSTRSLHFEYAAPSCSLEKYVSSLCVYNNNFFFFFLTPWQIEQYPLCQVAIATQSEHTQTVLSGKITEWEWQGLNIKNMVSGEKKKGPYWQNNKFSPLHSLCSGLISMAVSALYKTDWKREREKEREVQRADKEWQWNTVMKDAGLTWSVFCHRMSPTDNFYLKSNIHTHTQHINTANCQSNTCFLLSCTQVIPQKQLIVSSDEGTFQKWHDQCKNNSTFRSLISAYIKL